MLIAFIRCLRATWGKGQKSQMEFQHLAAVIQEVKPFQLLS